MKLTFHILILMFLSCTNSASLNEEYLKNNTWFDRYGNQYKFQDKKIEYKSILGGNWWEIGNFNVENNLLNISCLSASPANFDIKPISVNDNRIIFNRSIKICESILAFNEEESEFEIWRDTQSITDKHENIVSISFNARPTFMYSGIQYFMLNEDRVVEIGFNGINTVDTIFTLNDTTFRRIENLVQILPFEKFDDKYEYAIFDGVDYDIEVITNKVVKNISCKGSMPAGLNDLIVHISYEILAK